MGQAKRPGAKTTSHDGKAGHDALWCQNMGVIPQVTLLLPSQPGAAQRCA